MALNKETHGLDKKTYALIKQLLILKKDTPKKFSDIDEIYLQMLVNKEIDYDWIQSEKAKCRESVVYFIEHYI